jgi:hypothetical protein
MPIKKVLLAVILPSIYARHCTNNELKLKPPLRGRGPKGSPVWIHREQCLTAAVWQLHRCPDLHPRKAQSVLLRLTRTEHRKSTPRPPVIQITARLPGRIAPPRATGSRRQTELLILTTVEVASLGYAPYMGSGGSHTRQWTLSPVLAGRARFSAAERRESIQ